MKTLRIESKALCRTKLPLVVSIVSLLICLLSPTAEASEQWSAVDESVVEKYAEEYGRQARDPIINTDQGDLLLFVFLVAGAISGFAAGYYWRTLTTENTPNTTKEEQQLTG